MRFTKITKTIIAALILSNFVNAEEHSGGGEAPPSHDGKSPGAQTKEAGSGPNNTEFVEYSKRLNKMTQLQTKVNDETERLKDLIKQKNNGATEIKDDKNNRENILAVIVRQHKSLTTSAGLYNDELHAVTYRFPSKGEEIRRRYIPLRPKSIEQVEKELGLQGELTALKEKVDNKYKAFAPPEEPAPPKPVNPESTLKDKNAEKPPRLKLIK
jgi:hypothetical protein